MATRTKRESEYRSRMITNHIAALQALRGRKVEAGWFDSDRYEAEEGQAVGVSVAKIARLQEFGGTVSHPGGTKYITDAIVKGRGTGNYRAAGSRFVTGVFPGSFNITGAHVITIPARPFMRLAWVNFKQNSVKLQHKIAGQLVRGKITVTQGLNQIGMELENQIVKSIKTGPWVANAASTVAKKGFNKPLIDTAHMWKTVNSKVT